MNINYRKNRIAVSLFFFVNGFLHANLMARLPQFQSNLGISNSLLGTLLFVVAIGALLGMPITGVLVLRLGSDKMARLMALLFCLFLPLIPLVQNIWIVGGLFFMMGLSMGSMDVCMNGQAVLVERLWQKPIISSFHAIFSIGMASGAGVGALFSSFNIDLGVHIISMAIFSIGLIIWASAHLVVEIPQKEEKNTKNTGFALPTKAILPLGLIAFCCMISEGSMADWSAIYMSKVVGKTAAFSATAFGIYAAGMTIGRIFGDYLILTLGKKRLMIYDTLLAILGLSMALAYVSVPTTLIGFFIVGLGVSTIIPIVFSVAGNTEGVHPSVGIAMATSIGYTGFFIGPPIIGFLSDIYGLRIGLSFSLFLLILMFGLILRIKE